MTRRSGRLNDYVRQTKPLDEGQLAALGDPIAKQALFEEIVMETVDRPVPPSPSARRRRYAVAFAAGAVAVVASVLTVAVILGSPDRRPTATPPTQSTQQTQPATPEGDVFGSGTGLRCGEQYSPQTLTERGFAFDGTVVSVGARSATAGGDPHVPVVFQVNHWFKGGRGDRVTVAMVPPGVVTSVGNAVYGVGSRLLVSGDGRSSADPLDHPISRACGFTRWYTQADARTWAQTFR